MNRVNRYLRVSEFLSEVNHNGDVFVHIARCVNAFNFKFPPSSSRFGATSKKKLSDNEQWTSTDG